MRTIILNSRLTAILDFISAKFVIGYPCVRPYILFYIYGPAILLFFELRKYHKIIQIQNGRYQKLTRSLADIAEHICQIKKRFDRKFFLKRANEHFLVSGHSN